MQSKELHNKWVGLVEVAQLGGNDELGENRGANVTVIAYCEGKSDFEIVVERALCGIGLTLVESTDVETCEYRFSVYEVEQEFKDAVRQVSFQNPVVFMTFHTFPLQCH